MPSIPKIRVLIFQLKDQDRWSPNCPPPGGGGGGGPVAVMMAAQKDNVEGDPIGNVQSP